MLSRTQDLFQGVTMSLLLHVKPGAQPPFDHRCARETVIGRSEAADVSISSDRFISKEHAGFELTAFNKPSRTVSGDLYRIQTRKEGRESVLMIADVAGKGMSASQLTASLEALSVGPIDSGRSDSFPTRSIRKRSCISTPATR